MPTSAIIPIYSINIINLLLLLLYKCTVFGSTINNHRRSCTPTSPPNESHETNSYRNCLDCNITPRLISRHHTPSTRSPPYCGRTVQYIVVFLHGKVPSRSVKQYIIRYACTHANIPEDVKLLPGLMRTPLAAFQVDRETLQTLRNLVPDELREVGIPFR